MWRSQHLPERLERRPVGCLDPGAELPCGVLRVDELTGLCQCQTPRREVDQVVGLAPCILRP